MFRIHQLKAAVMRSSRNKKLNHFYSLCKPDSNILDVGITNNEHNDYINIFLNKFRFRDSQYVGLAVESMEIIRKKNPGKRFVEYSGGEFPFDDNEFDWVFSNAVIEHVGSRNRQLQFINEMVRVARNVFFTTPNRFFPIEPHTNTMFRHWFNQSFYKWCKINRPYWNENNLLLLGKKDILNLLEKSNVNQYMIKSNRILGYPMTYTIVCYRQYIP